MVFRGLPLVAPCSRELEVIRYVWIDLAYRTRDFCLVEIGYLRDDIAHQTDSGRWLLRRELGRVVS